MSDWILFWYKHYQIPVLSADQILCNDGQVREWKDINIQVDFSGFTKGITAMTLAIQELSKGLARLQHIKMLCFFIVVVSVIGIPISASAQTDDPCPVMPSGYLCISREAAQKALEAGDRAKALEIENTAQKAAYEKMRDALNDMRIEFARMSGENTALKTSAVRDAAIMDVLIKNSRKRSVGLIAF